MREESNEDDEEDCEEDEEDTRGQSSEVGNGGQGHFTYDDLDPNSEVASIKFQITTSDSPPTSAKSREEVG